MSIKTACRTALRCFAFGCAAFALSAFMPAVALAQQPLQLGVATEAQDDEANLPAVLRARTMSINTEPFHPLTAGAKVELNLFDDTTFIIVLSEYAGRSPTRYVWQGAIEGVPGSRFVLSIWDDALHLDLDGPEGSVYRIRGIPNRLDLRGVFAVRQLDRKLLGRCGNGPEHAAGAGANPGAQPANGERPRLIPHPKGSEQAPPGPGGTPSAPATPSEDGPQMLSDDVGTADIGVFWTLGAENGAGGSNNILAAINAAVADTNTSLTNSTAGGVARLQVDWIAGYRVNYSEFNDQNPTANDSVALDFFWNTNEGYMDDVHPYRTTHGLDLMVLIHDNARPGVCGVAYINGSFGVVKRECLGGANALTFAHELGHNFGLAHARGDGNAGGGSVPSPNPYSYGWGYRTPDESRRDTMAYPPGAREQVYSNPNWSGLGVPIDQPNSAFAALAIANNRSNIVGRMPRSTRGYVWRWSPSNQSEFGNGSVISPWYYLSNATASVPTGWTLSIAGGNRYTENIVINRPMILRRNPAGPEVIIGTPP